MRKNIILLIAEKPKAGEAIARALGGKWKSISNKRGYWLFSRGGKEVFIATSAGHLFKLDSRQRGVPVFKYEWKPIWKVEKRAGKKRVFYEVIKHLSRKADLIVNACDYDDEGSLIGYKIIESLGMLSRAKRMKYSTLTKQELVSAFNSLIPLDIDNVRAALTRHELDWIWGINSSRLLMKTYRRAYGKRIILSSGRVQSPVLAKVINEYIRRQTYIAPPEFVVKSTLKTLETNIMLRGKHKDSPFDKLKTAEEKIMLTKKAKIGVIEKIEQKEVAIKPPPPFNLYNLQIEAAKKGLSPSQTLALAEKLYLMGLISYPRTKSERLPPHIDNKKIMKDLREAGYREANTILKENPFLKYRIGRGRDPAHPAIYPTGKKPRNLYGKARLLYDLIVRRYLASFSKDSIATIRNITVKFGQQTYLAQQTYVTMGGWKTVYYKIDMEEKPPISPKNGEKVYLKKIWWTISIPHPPQPLTQSSLLSWMEKQRIGTPSTRTEAISILYKRGYTVRGRGGEIIPSNLGYKVYLWLKRYAPKLLSVKLTREFEEQIEMVRENKLDKETVIDQARKTISEIVTIAIEKESRTPSFLDKSMIIEEHLYKKAHEILEKNIGTWMERTGKDRKWVLEKIAGNKHIGMKIREIAREHLKTD